MTLQELSDAWNALRNAALGRGMRPRVSESLAARVGDAWERFRAWLSDQGPLADIVPSVTGAQWVNLHRELAEQVRGEGVDVADLPSTPFENVQTGAAIALALAGVIVGAMLFRGGRS